MSAYQDLLYFFKISKYKPWTGFFIDPQFKWKYKMSDYDFRSLCDFIDGRLFFNRVVDRERVLRIYKNLCARLDLPKVYEKISYTKLRMWLIKYLKDYIKIYDKRKEINPTYKNQLRSLFEVERKEQQEKIHKEVEQIFNPEEKKKDVFAEFNKWGYNPHNKIPHAFGKKK